MPRISFPWKEPIRRSCGRLLMSSFDELKFVIVTMGYLQGPPEQVSGLRYSEYFSVASSKLIVSGEFFAAVSNIESTL